MRSKSQEILFAFLDIFISAGVKVFEPKATDLYDFRSEVNFLLGLSLFKIAYPAAPKLATVISALCLLRRGCCSAKSQHLSSALLISSNCWTSSLDTRKFRHFSASCRLKQGVLIVLGDSFYSRLRIQNSVVKPFSTSGIRFFQGSSARFFSGVSLLWG